MMTATTDIATFDAAKRPPGERRRSRILLTLLLSLFLVYSLAPLVYLVLSATKTNGDLFATFGFDFGTEFYLWKNLGDVLARDDGIFMRWRAQPVPARWRGTNSGFRAPDFAAAHCRGLIVSRASRRFSVISAKTGPRLACAKLETACASC